MPEPPAPTITTSNLRLETAAVLAVKDEIGEFVAEEEAVAMNYSLQRT
jgi:hypothetical protein